MDLQSEYSELLKSKFPNSIDFNITYLDIINGQEKENIISKIYAFYLDPDKSPIISSWFVDSLLELIEEKTYSKLDITGYDVFTEYSTKDKKGRIDILIVTKFKKTVILIENKVNHILNNDLQNYWDTFENDKFVNKIGLVLGIKNIYINNKNFYFVTHSEWIQKVASKMDSDKISKKQLYQLDDFITNIKYITYSYNMNENIKFYLDNISKIDELLKFRDESYKFLNTKIQNVADNYYWKIHGNNYEFKQLWNGDKDERIFYTIFPNDILRKKEIKIVIEMDGDAMKFCNEIIDFFNESNYENYGLVKSGLVKNNYCHLALAYYKITDDEFSNLDQFIIEKINLLEPFRKELYNRLLEFGFKPNSKK